MCSQVCFFFILGEMCLLRVFYRFRFGRTYANLVWVCKWGRDASFSSSLAGHLELGAKINESLIRGKWATVQSGANGFKRGPISSQILKSGIRSNNLTNSGVNLSPWFKSGVVFKKSRSMQMRRLMPWWRYPPIRAPNQKATISNDYANLLVV